MSIFIWMLYCIFEGFLWGCIFSHNGGHLLSNKPYNIHISIIPIRLLVLFILSFDNWLNILIFSSMFPFLHNGFYYETRRMWGYNKYGFISESTTTNSKIRFKFIDRLYLFCISISIYMYYDIFK